MHMASYRYLYSYLNEFPLNMLPSAPNIFTSFINIVDIKKLLFTMYVWCYACQNYFSDYGYHIYGPQTNLYTDFWHEMENLIRIGLTKILQQEFGHDVCRWRETRSLINSLLFSDTLISDKLTIIIEYRNCCSWVCSNWNFCIACGQCHRKLLCIFHNVIINNI